MLLVCAGAMLAVWFFLELVRTRVRFVYRDPDAPGSGSVLLWTVLPWREFEFVTEDNGRSWAQVVDGRRHIVYRADRELCRRAWREK